MKKNGKSTFLLFLLGAVLIATVASNHTIRSRVLDAYRRHVQNAAASGKSKPEMPTDSRLAVTEKAAKPHGGRISLKSLDLSRSPSEAELRMAGQLGSPLSPSKPAEPSKITDPAQRKLQEKDNLLFGRAMQEWNQHNYPEAVRLFREQRSQFPDSPWAGEAELHLGCNAQFSGSWEEAKFSFDWIVNNTPAGSDISQKAKLRGSVLEVEQGDLDGATKSFTEMLASEKNWERTTYGHYWLRQLSLYKGNETALRDCGTDSVAYVLNSRGQAAKARELRRMLAPAARGFSVGELGYLARAIGLEALPVRADASRVADLPAPFIAHYKDRHFVVVKQVHGQSVRIYDPRLKRETALTVEQFLRQWSGLAVVFETPPIGVRLASKAELTQEIGGCCGIPRYPDYLGPYNGPGVAPLGCPKGIPQWQVNPVTMNVVVQDTPLWHRSEIGPDIHVTITYNAQDSLNQLRPFGNKWMLNYASYAMESPGGAPAGSVLVIMPEGSGNIFQPDGAGGYTSPAGVFSTLAKKAAFAFDLQLTDGATYHYGVPPGMSGTSSLLLSIEDRNHNIVTINHDSSGNVISVFDAQSRSTTFSYNANGYVSTVTDPFGRTATFTYDAAHNLVGQVDMGGTAYGYTFNANVYLTSIIKPSGTTYFYIEPADGIASSGIDPPPGTPMWENYRVTITDPTGFKEEYRYDGYSRYGWHRDRNQYPSTLPGSQAPQTRYYYNLVNGQGLLSQIAFADGKTVSFSNFTANLQPGQIVDENGGSQTFTYNASGQVLTRTDARTNTTTFQYAANNIDLIKITDPLSHAVQLGYDANRNLRTVTDALIRTATFGYNSYGQLVSITDASSVVWTLQYNGFHQLSQIAQGLNVVASFTYDAFGRVASRTDADGYSRSFTYDGRDRLLRTIYPDATFEENQWGCCVLDLRKDRAGRSTSFVHDALNRLVLVQDAKSQKIRLTYDANGNLTGLFDGNGNYTNWQYDSRNRPTGKTCADGSTSVSAYDGVGNVVQTTSAKNATTTLTYDENNNLLSIAAAAVPQVTFTYDKANRRTQMVDGIGTTTYTYDNANEQITEAGPLPGSSIAFVYDALGRLSTRTLSGVASSVTYDALGRMTTATNGLGTFTYSYLSAASPRLASVLYPNNQRTNLAYFTAAADMRLKTIANLGVTGSSLSQFDYSYNAVGQILTWAQQRDAGTPQTYSLSYDQVDQLASATLTVPPSTTLKTFAYSYDASGNRPTETRDGTATTADFNGLNEIISLTGAPLPAWTLEWDSAERVSAIVNGTHRTEFTYDGLGRRVRIVEKNSGTVVDDRRFVWCGLELCEERNGAGDTVTKRFYSQGVLAGTTKLLYTRDHLGSLRELADLTGAIRARYDYDPFGRKMKLTGDLEADFGFTGHYAHAQTGLNLAPYRAYNADLGRWLSRDPVAEAGGINLYEFVGNDPVNWVDPDGRKPIAAMSDFEKYINGIPSGRNHYYDNMLVWGIAETQSHLDSRSDINGYPTRVAPFGEGVLRGIMNTAVAQWFGSGPALSDEIWRKYKGSYICDIRGFSGGGAVVPSLGDRFDIQFGHYEVGNSVMGGPNNLTLMNADPLVSHGFWIDLLLGFAPRATPAGVGGGWAWTW